MPSLFLIGPPLLECTSQIQLGFLEADRTDLGAGPATDVGERFVMRIGLIVPPGFAVLNLAPLSVFEAAMGCSASRSTKSMPSR